MYRVLSLSLVAAALALFSATPTWAQQRLPGQANPPGVAPAQPANPANPAGANQGRAHEGKFVEAEGANKFVMTDRTGLHEHTHTLAPDAKIMCDGRTCRLSDLKKGTLLRVWTSPDHKDVATKVEATTTGRFPNQPGSTNPPGTINRR